MARTFLFRAAGVLALALSLAATAAADPPAPAKDDAANKRLVYMVKQGKAKDLAPVLADHFKGVAEVQALPDPTSNCLLISASPAALDEVVQVLAQLDRRPRTVDVTIMIADADPAQDVDEKAFAGPITDVEAKLDALQKKGALTGLKRIKLPAVEGQPASVTLLENKPYVTTVNITATGVVARSISYRNVGTKADATVRVSPENTVTVDLRVDDSRASVPDNGVRLGVDENGKPILATEFTVVSLNGKLDLASGQARAAEGVKTEAKSDKGHTIIVVGARVIDPDAGTEK